MSVDLDDQLTTRLRDGAGRLPVGAGDVDAVYRGGERRRRNRRRARVVGAALGLAVVVSVGTFVVPNGTTLGGVAWAGGDSAFTRTADITLPGEHDQVVASAKVGDRLYVATTDSGFVGSAPDTPGRVYVVNVRTGEARRLGEVTGADGLAAGRGGAVWVLGSNGVRRADGGRLGPLVKGPWGDVESAASSGGDVYATVEDLGTRHDLGDEGVAYRGGRGPLLVRIDGATGRTLSTQRLPSEYGEVPRIVPTAAGLRLVQVLDPTRVARVRHDGTHGPWQELTRMQHSGSDLNTIDGRHLYQSARVAPGRAAGAAVRRFDVTAGPDQRPVVGPVLVRSRGFETAVLDSVYASRGRVFASYDSCNGPMCLFELDARTLQQIGGPEQYLANPLLGSRILGLDGDTLWVATGGGPGILRGTHVLGLRVNDLS